MQNIVSKIDKDANVAVLCGGMSSEREVSLRSGKNCFEALKRLGFKNASMIDMQTDIAEVLKKNKIEYVLNVLHGKYGEDGCIQGLLELLKIPYSGSGVMASSICMNKDFTKKVIAAEDIPLIKSVLLKPEDDIFEKTSSINYPLMIKPVCEGSSCGMSKVSTKDELQNAVNEARKFNADILVEEFYSGISATVGVLENGEDIFATEILELRPKNEWYDYEAKYTKGMTEFILPAEIGDELTKKVKNIAVKAHKIAGCSGVSRVDFLIYNNIPYVLEINTNPGMTDVSDLPAQALALGIDYDMLVLLLLNSCGLNK